jgi:hypothetical protein
VGESAYDLARRRYGETHPPSGGLGHGRRVNGAAIVRALDALCISGNISIYGGGVSFTSSAAAFDRLVHS